MFLFYSFLDGDACTTDSCDSSTGKCVHTSIVNCNNNVCTDCSSSDPCNPKKCENGVCKTNPVVCPPNKCATITPTKVNGTCQCVPSNEVQCPKNPQANICGDNVCDPNTGVCGTTGNRVCDDNDPCTTDQCVVVQGKSECKFTPITCAGNSACSRKKCIAQNGNAVCVDDQANNLNCSSLANQCSTGTCNTVTGQCEFTPGACSNVTGTSCNRMICDGKTGKCVQNVPLVCPEKDPNGCGINGVCSFENGQQLCKYTPSCPSNDNGCIITNCVSSTNGSSCQTSFFSCDGKFFLIFF